MGFLNPIGLQAGKFILCPINASPGNPGTPSTTRNSPFLTFALTLPDHAGLESVKINL
jgi:hypothetical protein